MAGYLLSTRCIAVEGGVELRSKSLALGYRVQYIKTRLQHAPRSL